MVLKLFNPRSPKFCSVLTGLFVFLGTAMGQTKPNIIFIYADDLGYGDVSAYGANKIQTTNIDRLAGNGLLFTNAHATSATCTPSRYSLLTGEYAWRRKGTEIAPGNASMIIDTAVTTLGSLLQRGGYQTAVVGKWHLGLGGSNGPDWNNDIRPGPSEIGFNYSFIVPATLDRVPTVYIENHRVVNLDPADPITVSYQAQFGKLPTGKQHPELLKMKPSNGHNGTIINGISRIGYMDGGSAALWKDEEVADTLTARAIHFIQNNKDRPFFLYFASGDPHVPRSPHPRFVGKSGMGPRGDAILQLDWSVGQLLQAIERLGIAKNTLLVFTSDNGPVLDDGYQDRAVELCNGHTPTGPFRGGKYSVFEAGTRVPFIVSWPGKIAPRTKTNALISQVDMMACFAALTGQKLEDREGPDSYNMLDALLGKSAKGRNYLVEHAGTLALVTGRWKYIQPGNGPKKDIPVNIELGNDPSPQLYDLQSDGGEQFNLAQKYPGKVKKMAALLEQVKNRRLNRLHP